MKIIGLSCARILIFSIASGCAFNKSEEDSYCEDGKIDQSVKSWNQPGNRKK